MYHLQAERRMQLRYIINKSTGEKTRVFQESDCEMVNPIKHYGEGVIVKQMILNGVPKEELRGEKELSEKSKELFKNAVDFWVELKKGFQRIKIPENLVELLKTDRKKDQQKLLKGLVLTPEILMSFIFKAYQRFGFTLSQYSKEGLGTIKMPLAKIIDHGKHWHCFFRMSDDLTEEETSTDLHYLSSAFGIDRAEVVKQIKSREYKLGDLPHINLKHYGTP